MATNKEEEEYETDAYQGQLNPELANMLQVSLARMRPGLNKFV